METKITYTQLNFVDGLLARLALERIGLRRTYESGNLPAHNQQQNSIIINMETINQWQELRFDAHRT